ncbi:LuxR C-terminal-related transcriptional regulator [Salininema proteolyticum]|uniref:LuxR C-terminal-related transcriptional regulator n=1 Tax=Salininema proteolyticum TaxID=1607685 RepID=A0ABV8TZU9_9ACTN
MLEPLGFDQLTEVVYTAILEERETSVDGIAQSLKLAQETVAQTVDNLAKMQLIVENSLGRLAAVDPQLGLAAMLTNQHADLVRRQQDIERSRLAVATWLTRYSGDDSSPEPDAERILGRENIQSRLQRLESECESEVLSLSPVNSLPPTRIEESRPLYRQSLARGIRIRAVYLDSVRQDKPTMDHLRWLTAEGGQVRTIPSLPVRMLIVDRARALIPIANERCSDGALLLVNENVVTAMAALFLDVWRESTPIDTGHRGGEQTLTRQEIHVLRLWSQGLKDDAVARKMGLTSRTIRRISSDLMDKMGAKSRFMAGVLAVSQNWIDPHDSV